MSQSDFLIAAFVKNVERGKTRRIRKLLQVERTKSIILSMRTSEGCTPLHYAAHYARPEIVQLLLDAGCTPNLQIHLGEYQGMLPLHAAAISGCVKCVRALLKAYPQAMHMKDGIGYTPYHYAIDEKHEECIGIFQDYRHVDAASTMMKLSATT